MGELGTSCPLLLEVGHTTRLTPLGYLLVTWLRKARKYTVFIFVAIYCLYTQGSVAKREGQK